MTEKGFEGLMYGTSRQTLLEEDGNMGQIFYR